jgi:hypothetical protein
MSATKTTPDGANTMTITTKKIAFGTEIVYVDGKMAGRLEDGGDRVLTYAGRTLAEARGYRAGVIYGQYGRGERNQAVQDLAEDFTAAKAAKAAKA